MENSALEIMYPEILQTILAIGPTKTEIRKNDFPVTIDENGNVSYPLVGIASIAVAKPVCDKAYKASI